MAHPEIVDLKPCVEAVRRADRDARSEQNGGIHGVEIDRFDREQRRADGKTNVGWIAFLVIAYLLSISYLAFFILLMISAFTGESVTVG